MVGAWPLGKNHIFEALNEIPPKNVTTKLEGGGGGLSKDNTVQYCIIFGAKALVVGPLKK